MTSERENRQFSQPARKRNEMVYGVRETDGHETCGITETANL